MPRHERGFGLGKKAFVIIRVTGLQGARPLLSGWLAVGRAARLWPGQTEATPTPQSAAVKICSSCHGMQMVTDTPRDWDAWHDTVQKMIDRGARGTPEEFDLVMDFLFQNVTPVDVNHADRETLMAILHAPPASGGRGDHRAPRVTPPFKDLAIWKAPCLSWIVCFWTPRKR